MATRSAASAAGPEPGAAAATSGDSRRWLVLAGIAFAGGLPLPTRRPRTPGARVDILGAVLVVSGMFCLVYGLANAATHSWGTPSTWGFLAASGALLTGFASRQFRASQPLLPPRVVLHRTRGGGYLCMLVIGAGTFGILLFLMYYFQTILEYSEITAGLALVPMVGLTAVAANVGNVRLMPRYGPRPLAIVGMLLSAAGTAWLTRIGVDSGYASAVLGPVMVLGTGMGLIYAAALQSGTSAVAPSDAGRASATIQVGQQLGGAIGTALLNTIAAGATASYLTNQVQGEPTGSQLAVAAVDGYTTVFWWCTGLFVAGAVVCGALLRLGPLPAPAWAAAPEQTEPAQS